MRQQLYRTLTAKLQRRLPASSKPQVQNLALLTQALAFSPDCHLSNLALQLPISGQRENLTQRLRRLLEDSHVRWRTHYLPLVKELLAYWTEQEVNLVMDRTDIRQEKSILMLALAFKTHQLFQSLTTGRIYPRRLIMPCTSTARHENELYGLI